MIVKASEKIRLGDLLVEEGILSPQQLDHALQRQKATGAMLGEVLVEQGLVDVPLLVKTLSNRLGVRGCVLHDGLVDPAVFSIISPDDAKRHKAVPLFKIHNRLTVAMAEPQSLPTIDRLREMTGCRVKPVLALEQDIQRTIEKYADRSSASTDHPRQPGRSGGVGAVPSGSQRDESVLDLDLIQARGDLSPAVRLVNAVLLSAIRHRASDVHIEPTKTGCRVRHRIDGALHELSQAQTNDDSPHDPLHPAVVSRVKVLGAMDIAEKRLPQEGRVRVMTAGREIDLRISSIPTLLGEKLVLRLLDKSNLKIQMEDLGFHPAALETFLRILVQPYGLVLVTGPTGSGKTTTLYSALHKLHNVGSNIVAVEDPVEYQIDGINQVQVQDAIGMSFARALRSILRQDPDIIMVGEIRDEETARVAVQAALTGHLVLATLHTNDAPGAVGRLLDMNVKPYLLSGALNGVVAQRLARKNCTACVAPYTPDPRVLADAGLSQDVQTAATDGQTASFKRGAGCPQCHNSGYKGRVGIYEVMEVNGPLRRLVHAGAPAHEIRQEMRCHGASTLRDEGKRLAALGITTVEEILRVTYDESEDQAS